MSFRIDRVAYVPLDALMKVKMGIGRRGWRLQGLLYTNDLGFLWQVGRRPEGGEEGL